MNYPSYFASTYGSGSYDNSAYNGATATSTATGTSPGQSNNGNVLTNTGFDIAVAVTLASVIIFSALVIKFWQRGKASPPDLTK